MIQNRWHVIPVNDLREHEATPACWCKPTPDEEHDMFVHNAMDRRVRLLADYERTKA